MRIHHNFDRNPLAKDSSAGFTLVEICIALGMVSILMMALMEMNTLTALSMQSNGATDEFNQEAGALLTMLNSNGTVAGANNGCTTTFKGMSVPGPPWTTALPVITAQPITWPDSVTNFITNITAATAPTALYTDLAHTNIFIQVTAPSAANANGLIFPPPKNHLWVTKLAFTGVVDTNVAPPPALHLNWIANLYILQLQAQKVSSAGQKILGGETTYSKDFLVTLWVDPGTNQVVYCGPNPS